MRNYKSFSSSKQKLSQLWEQNQDNTHNISTFIKTIDTNFLSIHDLKTPQSFILLDNFFQSSTLLTLGNEFVLNLIKFPDFMIPFCHLVVIISTWDITTGNFAPIDITKAIPSLSQAALDGTLKEDDIEILLIQHNTWWTKINNDWNFTFQPYFIVIKATNVSNPSYIPQPIPLYITAKLNIINEKTYNAIQSGR